MKSSYRCKLKNPSTRTRLTGQGGAEDVYAVCRRGNDSQRAAVLLRELLPGARVRDVIGGLRAWARHIDSSFPVY